MLQCPIGNRAVLPPYPVPFLEFSPFVSEDVMMFCLVELNEVLGVFLKGGCIRRTYVRFYTWSSDSDLSKSNNVFGFSLPKG